MFLLLFVVDINLCFLMKKKKKEIQSLLCYTYGDIARTVRIAFAPEQTFHHIWSVPFGLLFLDEISELLYSLVGL